MAIPRWKPSKDFTRQEQFLLKRLKKHRKLFLFLRMHRHEIFDNTFQDELASMYRRTGAGKIALPPALLAMACIIQGYVGASDAEAVELTLVDLRWQLVLDCLGATEPAFSQGALQDFRQRLIKTNMDRRLLERTIELAKNTKEFDWKKLPKTLRLAVDSCPLEGAGRVEDTLNLLGRAAKAVVQCVADALNCEFEDVCRRAGIEVLLFPSVKTGLDRDWSDREQRDGAIKELMEQIQSLQRWIGENLSKEIANPPLSEKIEQLQRLIQQDLEPDPNGRGPRIKDGVAPNRQISISDSEMRHGRKSKKKSFNGYKRHIATDLDTGLIYACAMTGANEYDSEAAPELNEDMKRHSNCIGELYIDRAYMESELTDNVLENDGEVICRPWNSPSKNGQFPKSDFKINMRDKTITCPGGKTQNFNKFGKTVFFDVEECIACPLQDHCTDVESGCGRSIHISTDEKLQKRLRKLVKTEGGRQRLRQRVGVEHSLSHIVQRQGRKARYKGNRKNLYDLRRAAVIQNLENIQRKVAKREAA